MDEIMNNNFVDIAASLAGEEGTHSGKIVVKSRNSQFKVTLPYIAEVLKGELKVNSTSTHFYLVDDGGLDADSTEDNMDRFVDKTLGVTAVPGIRVRRSQAPFKRNITIKNEFSVPVVVHKVYTVPSMYRSSAISYSEVLKTVIIYFSDFFRWEGQDIFRRFPFV